MARLNGMKALFNMNQVRSVLQAKVDEAKQKNVEALQYLGEEFINKARQDGNYTDRTGNLRASVGYVILEDGKEIYSSFPGETNEGVESARDTINEVSAGYNSGLVLIGVAGMNYAAAVESLGYDVITGSAPNSNDIKDLLGAIKL